MVFVSGCLVWVPVAVWVLSLIQWMVLDEIDVLFGIPGVMAGVMLGAATMSPPHPSLSPLFLAVAFLTVLLFPGLRTSLNRRALHRIDVESLAGAYKALAMKPDNVGLLLKAARIVSAKGLPAHAAAVAESALQGLPTHLFEAELRELGVWRAQAQYPGVPQQVSCLECGAQNPPAGLHCRGCHAPYLLHWVEGRWVDGRRAGKFVSTWIAAVGALVAIPYVAMTLNPGLALAATVAILATVGALLWAAFRSPRRQIQL